MALAAPSNAGWKPVLVGSSFDPNNDQQSSADSDLLGNASNPMLQAQSVAISGDTVYYFRVRVGSLGNGNASSSFYLALDLDGAGNFPAADMFVEARYSIQGTTLKKGVVAFHKADFANGNTGFSPSTTAWQSAANNDAVEYTLLSKPASGASGSNNNAYIGFESTGSDIDVDGKNDYWVVFGFTLSQLNAWAKTGISGGGSTVPANNVVTTTVTGSTALALFAFTSTSQTANGDIAGIDDKTANLSQSWSDLGVVINSTLDNVAIGAPSAPTVTALKTADTTPVVTGSAKLSDIDGNGSLDDTLSVTINGTVYSGANISLTRIGTTDTYQWAVQVTTALASGTYDVTATTTRSGTSVSDSTSGELVINTSLPPQTPQITSYADDVSPQSGNFGTGTRTNDTAPVLQGVLDAPLDTGTDVVRVYRSTSGGAFTLLGTATVSGTSWSYADGTVTALTNNTTYTYKAVVYRSTSGEGSNSNLFNLTVDTTAPTVTVGISGFTDDVGASTGDITTSGTTTDDAAPLLYGTFPSLVAGTSPLASGDKLAIYRGGTFVGYGNVVPVVSATDGSITGYTWDFQEQTLDPGTYSYTARIVDSAGNLGTASSSFSIVVNLPVDVNDITVNEGSAYAVFTVTGTAGQTVTLSLADGTATGGGTDYGGVPNLQYTFDGASWTTYSSGIALSAGSTRFFVRTPINNDATYEGAETFTLTASNGSVSSGGTATIKDDGTGTVYTGAVSAGAPVTTASTNDDRSISVSAYQATVNEASSYAFFTVTATAGQVVMLDPRDVNDSGSGKTASLGSATTYYSVNGGLTWLPYDSNTGITVPSGGSFKVRVGISAEQDFVAEGNETFGLRAWFSTNSANNNEATVTLSDTGSGAIFYSDGTLDIATAKDTDTAGLTLSAASGNTTEAGGTATFTVKLSSQPTSDVTLSVSSSDTTEGTVSPTTLTFTSVNWNTAQTVTVTGVDDYIVDGTIAYTVNLSGASSDANYSGKSGSVSLSTTDNDTAGLTVSTASGNTTEAGGTATFTVKLSSQPSANVTVSVSSSNTAEGTVSPTTLTFTTANWNTAQTVTATGVDDALIDGTVSYTASLSSTSTDSNYNGKTASVSLANADNDVPDLTLVGGPLSTSESGTTASFTLVLTTQPTSDVTVTLTGLDATEGSLSASTLTFTPSNWSTSQTVTVTGVDDNLLDGAISYTLTATSASTDTNYASKTASVSVTNADNDTGSLVATSASGNTTEAGGTATFTVKLSHQPTSNVTVTVASSDTTEGTVSPTTLTFTSSNWSTAQTVTVTGVDDSVIDGTVSYTANLSSSSTDTNFNSKTASVSLSTTDDDTAALQVSSVTGGTTEAGGTATFTVKLTSQPTQDVTVSVSSSDTTEGTVSPATLTFTSANWNTAQTVTATGVDDAIIDGTVAYTADLSVASSDANYSGLSASVSLSTTDNDSASLVTTSASGNTTEAGGTATFTVKLSHQPTADVTVTVASSDTTEGTVSPTTLTFTSSNWNTDQTVTATGVDDAIIDGTVAYTVNLSAASSDTNFNSKTGSVSLATTDNDSASLVVSSASGNTTEAGGTATFTVKLSHQPTSDVTVTVTSSDTTEGTVSPTTLTFTSSNWNTAQTVTATGVDDAIIDGTVAYTANLSAASSDANYSGLSSSVSLSTTDNDTGSLVTTAASGNTTEAGGTATFTVKLSHQPSADVTVTVASSDTTEGTVSPTTLTFTSSNWNTAQTVTATGVDDPLIDGTVPYTATLSSASTDSNFNAKTGSVSLSTTDNDVAALTLVGGPLTTSESGSTASFTLALATQPTANVTIILTGLDATEGSLSATTLTFTQANWNTAQTVTVTGADDVLLDGSISYALTATSASGDSNYSGKTATVTVNNTDDEAPSITSDTVNEASPWAVWTVTATAGTPLSLSLSGTATGGGIDRGPDLLVSTDGGAHWAAYSAASLPSVQSGRTSFLVRTQIVDDTISDSGETIILTATPSGGTAGTGTITINDAGSGQIFNADGTTNASLTRTHDRPTVTVSTVTVSEAKTHAVVSVSLSNASTHDISFTPSLSSGTATIGTDTGSTLEWFNGTSWVSTTASTPTIGAGSLSIQLRVALVQDTLANEGTESFTLSTGTITGGARNAPGTSGTIYITDMGAVTDPVITDVTELSPPDPTPYDLLTADTTQVVSLRGETGCTISLYKRDANGQYTQLVSSTLYTTSEASGTYTLDFGVNALASGDYAAKLTKSGYTSNLSNSFTIDSTPGLYDITSRRELVTVDATTTITRGAVGGMDQNRLPSYWDGTDWRDADGEAIRFSFDTPSTFAKNAVPNGSTVTKTAASGSTLQIDTQSGSYAYTPSATAKIDQFLLYGSDGSKGASLTLTFDARDSLDRDGIAGSVETRLAAAANAGGGAQGDLNGDGIADASQNAVTTLAWTTVDKFNDALAGTLNDFTKVMSLAIVQSTSGSAVDESSQLSDVKVLAPNSAATGGSKPTNASWDPIQFTIEPLQSIGLLDADPTRAGTQVRMLLDVSRAQVAAGTFTAYSKYVDATAAATNTLHDLDGNLITAAGWYDFTQRTPGGDGARFITQGGFITAIELTLTDNAFGDNDMTVGRIVDPGVPTGSSGGGGGSTADTTPPLITGPSGGAGAASSAASVPENTLPVTTFTANEPVTWSLAGGTDAGRFQLDPNTGVLRFSVAPDWELPVDANGNNVYELQVRATDGAGNASAQSVQVTVTDVNEAVPVAPPVAPPVSDPALRPVYALNQETGDKFWVSAASAPAGSAPVIYTTTSTAAGTVPLLSWYNVLTGDWFYAPQGAKLPYECYVPMGDPGLGRVYAPGQGGVDIHLYLRADGITQEMSAGSAQLAGLLAQGYVDLGTLFASL